MPWEKEEAEPCEIGILLADIACAKPLYNWSNDEEIAAKIKKIKPCEANFRYMELFKSWLTKAPKNSKTAKALTKLIEKLEKYERSHRIYIL
ncbi:MAG TPA: hypothetical protein P5080_04705 [Candidatus Paceibacterota bacterium]|nr:hypothetical protein [Candidatus Pacearchaeota archaeon]HRZ51251.1 hypothetical protein [Candidatus Paceibacterota bacterium]HSA36973.1 hypothetical protein [Candidatus Paceibacterota bacterium]